MAELAEISHEQLWSLKYASADRMREDRSQGQGPEHVTLGGELYFPGAHLSQVPDFILRKVPASQPKHDEDPEASV